MSFAPTPDDVYPLNHFRYQLTIVECGKVQTKLPQLTSRARQTLDRMQILRRANTEMNNQSVGGTGRTCRLHVERPPA